MVAKGAPAGGVRRIDRPGGRSDAAIGRGSMRDGIAEPLMAVGLCL